MRKVSDDLWVYNTRDLMRASSCDHCTRLAIARELDVPGVKALVEQFEVPVAGLPVTYGQKFESELEAELLASLGAENFRRPEGSAVIAETIELMKAGTPVIYQGSLEHQIGLVKFSGRPDFLVRADYDLAFVEGKLTAHQAALRSGASGYIAWDAKLAGSPKPHYLLQVALYVDALASIGLKAQGAHHGLILGSRTLATYEEGEIVPAMRQARSYILEAIEGIDAADYSLESLALHCDSADSCKVCEYPGLCDHNRREIDHLVQVAGINKSQIEKLKKSGIATMAALAKAESDARPDGFVPATFDKLRSQARLQNSYKVTGTHSWELLEDPEIGVLPPASPNDIFFDMEGFPYFVERGGLEYLFGAVTREKQFFAWFAHDRNQEAEAFAGFVKWAYDKLQADPTAHIYHYAPYEVSALNRMVARHGVMAEEVAWLLAEDKLIDLYKVIRGSIMISQPSYSIKKLEVFYDFARKSKVVDAGSSIEQYDQYCQLVETDPAEAAAVLQMISDYNEDDCVSTLELYNWLAGMSGAHAKYDNFRSAVASKKAEWATDPEDEDSATSRAERELAELQQATDHMAGVLDGWPWGEDADADYRARVWQALMHSVLFYKREEVIYWRERRIRRDSTTDNLHRDRKALVVEGCSAETELDFELGIDARTKITVTYNYDLDPGQTNFLKAGETIYVRHNYGANQHELDKGKIVEIHGGRVTFERKTTLANSEFAPNAIFEDKLIPARGKQDAVKAHALALAGTWATPAKDAPAGHPALDLLMRREPSLGSATLQSVLGDDYLPALIHAVENLDHSVLAVQGPPGSGKTYLGSRTIAHLVAQGKRIGVVANSHSAVENLLAGCIEAGVSGESIAKQKKAGEAGKKAWTTPSDYKVLGNWRAKQQGGYVIGGTAWTFCSPKVLEEDLDFIFIDEAAQFSLVDAIAVAQGTKNLVLLGDPQQLTQVVQAVHPGGVDNSALGHYMGDQDILDAEHGYFIEVTRRMHPKVNQPVSWLAYEGRLHSHPDASGREIAGLPQGLELVPVEHFGNSSHSEEEVAKVLELTRELTAKVGADEVLIVAPYNAQVDSIRDALDANGFAAVQVGTVDKFQGREAMVVIISLASSTAEDAPRGLEFLLDRNRLNVALSRAKTNSYLVHSPALIRSRFTSVEDVKAVSRLAGLLEFAN
jgi:predicted RecB family nuclease